MIEIGRDEYDELLEMATKLSILERLIKDEEKNDGHYIDIDLLKVILGVL